MGVSEDHPEGLYGVCPEPEDRLRHEKLRRKLRRQPVTRASFGWSEENHMPPAGAAPVAKSKKAKKLKKHLGERPVEAAKKKKKGLKIKKILPDFDINYASTLPDEARGLSLKNVVRFDEHQLKRVIRNTEDRTQGLSALMLQSVAPAVLSFDAASSYVAAVLRAGLKIDTEIDRGVAEIVQDLGRLEVVDHFIDKLQVGAEMKAQLRLNFANEFTATAMASMARANKSASMSNQIRELEGVLVKNSERKDNEKSKAMARRKPLVEPTGGSTGQTDGVRRSRSDRPMSGGF